MILFSTILKIKDALTKEQFIDTVIEWNNSSTYKENIVSGVNADGKCSGRYGTDNLSMEFVEYPEANILAVRHEKITGGDVIWDTDFIVNFNERNISIRLDRTYGEDAVVMNGAFSTPHFISLLIEKGYLADDHGLPVLRTPIELTDSDAELFADIEKTIENYQLPIIYIAKTFDDENPLDVKLLASRLKGAAHVLVEKDKTSCKECIRLCGETKENFGAVRIYYPAKTMPRKRFLYRSKSGNAAHRLENVVRHVVQYRNTQKLSILYTWNGVTNTVLGNNLDRQMSKRLETEAEINQVYEVFDEDLKSMQRKLSELAKANESLILENSILRAKLNATGSLPIVYQGEEEDFYPDEIKDMILEILDRTFNNVERPSRRADVLEDILQNNTYQHLGEDRKDRVKNLFKGYTTLSSAMKQELMNLGITIADDGKHYKLTYHNDPRYMVTIGKTPSDRRAGSNNAALVNKIML